MEFMATWWERHWQKPHILITNKANILISRSFHNMLIILFIWFDIVNNRLKWLLTKWTFCLDLQIKVIFNQKGTERFLSPRPTLDHSNRHWKQNWCMQESEKHLFVQLPRHIAQFGGVFAELGRFIITLASAISERFEKNL